jgi:hypothetical protein
MLWSVPSSGNIYSTLFLTTRYPAKTAGSSQAGRTVFKRRPGTAAELGRCVPRIAIDGANLLIWESRVRTIPGASPLGLASGCLTELEAVRPPILIRHVKQLNSINS